MAQQSYPVYLIAGFLDGGKTSFINGILSDGFALEERTMLLCCEEGEVDYDPKVLRNVTVVTVDDLEQLTPEFLLQQQKKCRATQIIVEYNGMWQIQDFYMASMPSSWVLYQIIVMAEGPTFESYTRNMGSLMLEKLRNAAMAKIKAGRRAPGMVLPATTSFTKSAVSSRSRQTPLIVQASIRMAQAGSMDFMPS